jgi:hypothetical protein
LQLAGKNLPEPKPHHLLGQLSPIHNASTLTERRYKANPSASPTPRSRYRYTDAAGGNAFGGFGRFHLKVVVAVTCLVAAGLLVFPAGNGAAIQGGK